MDGFIVGDTIKLDLEILDFKGTYKNPSTSTVIKITKPDNVVDVNDVAMTNMRPGVFRYLYDSSGKPVGEYAVLFTATSGTDVKRHKDGFTLE